MRILITGSRHWTNEAQITEKLLELRERYGFIEIAHGASKGGGVDLIVSRAANKLGISQTPFPVLPRDGNHRGAPINRNKRMVMSFMPDLVVGFRSEGKSNGTDQTLAYAQQLGYATEIVSERT
jgi:hypothetical protein